MGGGGYDVGVGQRVLQQTGGDETGGMGHVYHEDGADSVCHGTHAGVVPVAGICACSADNQFGAFAQACFFEGIIVDTSGFCIHVVFQGVEHQSGEVHGAAVAQMAAVAKVQADELVAGFEAGHEHGHVGLCSRVWLYVGVFGAKKAFHAFAGEVLHLVHYLASAVVASAGIALGVFVCETRAHGAHHLVAHVVFGSD